MEFDEIVIGSGLVALGAVLGIERERSVLVIGGPQPGRTLYYGTAARAPCGYLGSGGLGNFWHGVIPTGLRDNFAGSPPAEFARLFGYFYRRANIAAKLGAPWLFVPWRPIRPDRHWRRLRAERGAALQIVAGLVVSFEAGSAGVVVRTQTDVYRGRRLWVCAGAMHTPPLLDRSLGTRISKPTVSDHVICYLGQTRHAHAARPGRSERAPDGVWFEAEYNRAGTALLTRKPAHFGFRTLDYGIEQRGVFGLPTGGVLAKLARAGSPGLIAEALYNRAALLPRSSVHSIYAQIVVADAHELPADNGALTPRVAIIRAATDRVRDELDYPGLIRSRCPELFIPGIHLHHSLDAGALHAAGVNRDDSALHVLDASVYPAIGPEHHSFKLMLAAALRTRSLSGGLR
ncbi:MAG TPA: hypothetical protein VH814_07560 [Steroidobacteraceae bacterium]